MTIQEIFQLAAKKNASDVHLATGASALLRIDGKLVEIEPKKILSAGEIEKMILSLLNEEQKTRFINDK